jgi:type IV pilus assembly protein PilV
MKFNSTGFRCKQMRTKQGGATLIEILVAVLILSFGMLGMSALQIRALQGNQSSIQRSQATMLSYYIMDAMRVDRESAKGGDYNTNSGFVCGSVGITGSGLAKDTLRNWLDSTDAAMGGDASLTCGSVACDGNYQCTVRIKWDDTKAGGQGNQQVELISVL